MTPDPGFDAVRAHAEHDGRPPFSQAMLQRGVDEIEVEIKLMVEAIIETPIHRVV
jgi:hypothetical protein